MGGESEATWRALLDNLVNRGLKTPELVIVDGATGLEKALAALWSDMLVQPCTVHKHRMIYADSKQEIESKRKAFIRKWRLKCRAAVDSLEEAGNELFAFARFPSGNRSAHRMQLNVCTKSSRGESRPKPCCRRLKPRRCCSGHCWLLARTLCAKSTAGEA
jgi:transposase-like protein